ncbi:MAG: tRNA 5-carboxymethoxyuridine methyltransferase [Phycisphaerae bacterium]|nr:tRNA 5-carboxymethoxyuridine methyltransferase [Phycisphaerae bacterium]
MKRDKKRSVQRYHDRVAHRYDAIYDDRYWQWHDALTWDYLKPHLPTDLAVPLLDMGCGTGKWGLKLAQSGFRVTCVDISLQMVETVRRKIAELGLEQRVEAVQADVEDLSALPRDHFGVVTAFGEPLGSVQSPARAVGQLCLVLRPGGLLIGTIDNQLAALDYYLQKQDVAGLEKFVQDGRTHWLTRAAAEQFELHTFSPLSWSRLLEKCGYEVVELRGKSVLPIRQYAELLEDREGYRRLLQIEEKLSRLPDAVGRAAHLQFVARKI